MGLVMFPLVLLLLQVLLGQALVADSRLLQHPSSHLLLEHLVMRAPRVWMVRLSTAIRRASTAVQGNLHKAPSRHPTALLCLWDPPRRRSPQRILRLPRRPRV